MSALPTCPSCGKPLAPDAPKGLCQECLLKAGFPSGTESGAAGGASRFVPPSVEEVRKLFPHLEIIELIGRGGMGAVYKARQRELDRLVALKILPPGIGDDRAFADRFVREAKALAKLNHPNIVTLYEFDHADGLFYFMMEFVDGVNLRQLLQAGRLASREALAIVPQICDALQYAHDQGIVHRDIKPENILLDRRGHVKVADFGVARLMGIETEVPAGGGDQLGSVSLTEAGKVMGTPQYMAPEQKENPTEVDHRADIYSLGVVFYQMLTGELPGKPIEAPSKKLHLDVRLDEVVLRALEKEPERRYQEASQFKTRVETIAVDLENGAPSRRLLRWAAVIACALLIPIVIVVAYLSDVSREFSNFIRATTQPAQTSPGTTNVVAAIASAPFGPVHEFALNDSGEASYIDLDTDRILPEFAGNVADFDAQTWRRTNGIDISQARLVTGKEGAGGYDLTFKRVANSRWLTITPGEVAKELTKAQSAQNALLEADNTYVVRTREGGQGVLQVVGLTKQPHAVTVRYKLVQNSATKVAASTSAAVSSQTAATFGPVIERVVNDGGTKRDCLIDLDTGKVFSAPEDQGPRVSAESQDAVDIAAAFTWLTEHGIDATAEPGKGIEGLIGFSLRAGEIANELWNRSTPEDLPTLLSKQPAEAAGKIVLSGKGGLPKTFAFQTREGGMGILQITAITDKPRGVKIRYKLVQPATADVGTNNSWPATAHTKTLMVTTASESDLFLNRVLDTLGNEPPSRLSPEDYERQRPTDFDAIIFDGYCPQWRPAAGNLIYFGCAPTTGPLRPADVAGKDQHSYLRSRASAVRDWRRDHELLQGINFSNITASMTLRLEVPADATVLIDGTNGPMMVLRRDGSRTELVVAFSPRDSNWPLRTSFPVFMQRATTRASGAAPRPASDKNDQ